MYFLIFDVLITELIIVKFDKHVVRGMEEDIGYLHTDVIPRSGIVL